MLACCKASIYNVIDQKNRGLTMKTKHLNQTIILKIVISIAIILFSISAYFSFGFFFDVFVEVIPLMLIPVVLLPPFWHFCKNVNKVSSIAVISIMIILVIASATGTGIVASSKPAFGVKPICGSVETYKYSRDYMLSTYNINQQTVIKIWVPDNYSTNKKYPVMYVFDGDNLFNYAAVKAAEHCKNNNGDMIIVGIGYGYWNASFARGGIVYQDTKNLRGRWRDYCFADDTQKGYMPGTIFGGESKRGKEYTDFIVNTVVKDIRTKYSVDNDNSTIFGHSLGGGLAAYFLTQYDPALKENNPFTNFVIVDNGYLDYYNKHYQDLKDKMNAKGNSAHKNISVYRIWGGSVHPQDDSIQYDLYMTINRENWQNVNNYFWIPEGANHADTQTIGIENAENMILGLDFGKQI